METNQPNWSDQFSSEELAAALDYHAAIVAKQRGWYEIAGEMRAAAACIRELAETNDRLCTSLTEIAGQAFEIEARTDQLARRLNPETAFKDRETEEQIRDALDRGEYR